MNETAEEHGGGANQERSPPASSSPLSTQIWLPAESPLRPPWMNHHQTEQDQDSLHHYVEMQPSPPSRFYEELFCTSHTSGTLVPLSGALVTSSGPQSDVVKQSYLGKLERNRRRYFVLRAGSHTGPSRLEWYKSRERFAAMEKSAGKAALFGSSKQGVIYLRCCLGVSRSGSSRKGHTVALYAKNQTVILVVEDQCEQEEWYLAIKKLMEEERKDEEDREGFDEEDDGYCTLPPAAFFKEVWPVTVKPRGLGCSKSLAGESRLCLSATSLILIRVAACSDFPSVTMPLLSVRRFGHLDGSFFLELGRSAATGPGEIWMEARDQAGAQHIHEVVRETVRALRALPDFSRSPTSNHSQLQTLLASKRCRPKYRDKPGNTRPLGSRLALPSRNPESPTKHSPEPESTSHLGPFTSRQSSTSETGSYVEMMPDQHLAGNKGGDCGGATMATGDRCGVAAGGMEGWGPGGEQGLGYMMMSPQARHSSPVQPQGDYVTMASPQKHNWPAYSSPSSSPQTSFSGSASDSYSPLHPSHHHSNEHSRPQWPATSVHQSQLSIGCSARPQDDARREQTSAKQRRLPAQSRATPSPVRGVGGSGVMTPFVTSGPVCTKPVQASPISGTGRSVRRHRLSLCLPSCLQAEDRY